MRTFPILIAATLATAALLGVVVAQTPLEAPTLVSPPGDPDAQIAHVPWTVASHVSFQGRDVQVPPGTYVATDGASYLYTTPDASVLVAPEASLCARESPPPAATPVVLLYAPNCFWVAFPGVGCAVDGSPCGPSPRPTEVPELPDLLGHATPATVTTDQYLQVGVSLFQSSSVVSYGISGGITMSNNADTYTFASSTEECHYRWPSQKWSTGSPHLPFIQAGTKVCNDQPSPGFQYGAFCDYFDQNNQQFRGDSATWYGWSSTSHSYAYYSSSNTATYKCWRDGTMITQVNAFSASTTGPELSGVSEASASVSGLDTTKTIVDREEQNPAVQYRDSSGAFHNAPHETWYSTPLGGNTSPCSFSNFGVSLIATDDLNIGYGFTCRDGGGSAW